MKSCHFVSLPSKISGLLSALVSTVPVAKVPPTGTGARPATNCVVKFCILPCKACSLASPSGRLLLSFPSPQSAQQTFGLVLALPCSATTMSFSL
eukprot:2330520-Amphidinium_carterae.1